ncbi:MAG: hypothetical protein ABI255_06100 [Microbacteriaceae bacterium]
MIPDSALLVIGRFPHFLSATPTPSPAPGFNPDTVTPGLVGFLVIFVIAVATILLIVDMNRRIRRTRYRADITAQLDAEERAGSESDIEHGSGHDQQRGGPVA